MIGIAFDHAAFAPFGTSTWGIVENATDNAAHVGGLVAGGLLGAILPLAERLSGRPPGPLARLAGAVAGAALLATFAFVLREGFRSP